MIYFDNAATTFPKPKIVAESFREVLKKYAGNPGRSGHNMAMQTSMMVYKTREAVAEFFNVNNVEDVVFTLNCTMATNVAIKGVVSQGDHVVISSYEHNAVLRPVYKLKTAGVISFDVAQVYENDDARTIDSFRKAIRRNTKLVISIHGSNVFGNILPIKDISKLAHQNGAMFMLDAAQSAGVVKIDVQDMGIDLLCAPGHKSLYGHSGTGILITNHGEKLNTLIEGGTGSLSQEYSQPNFMPDKFESGTVNTMGIWSLYNGIKFINQRGIENIYKHEIKIAQYIYSNLAKNNKVYLYTQFPQVGTHLPVLSFNIKNYSCDDVIKILNNKGFALRGGLHCSPLSHKIKGSLDVGTVRISVGAFNNILQARKLCEAINLIK